jgi:hypothetical protein
MDFKRSNQLLLFLETTYKPAREAKFVWFQQKCVLPSFSSMLKIRLMCNLNVEKMYFAHN